MARTQKNEAAEFAGEQRKQYVDALKVELEGYKRSGNEDRQNDVLAEIKRVTSRAGAQSASAPTANTASTPPATA
jgi:hypothetical protein